MMWYVVQVFTGQEEKLRSMCRKQIRDKEILAQCFVPYYMEMKKYEGQWHKEKRILFPGYIFVDTEQAENLYLTLKKVPAFTKILGDKEYLIPLTAGETAFLQKIGGPDQVVEMSTGVIENDKVKITDGPMMGMEGFIRKINRHKRKAVIEVEMFGGRKVKAEVGLEVVRKS